MGADGASGRIGEGFAWELALEGAEQPLFHLPRAWMYRARLPRTKLLSPAPAARFSGRLSVEGREIPVDGWRGWRDTTGARSMRSAGSGCTG